MLLDEDFYVDDGGSLLIWAAAIGLVVPVFIALVNSAPPLTTTATATRTATPTATITPTMTPTATLTPQR